MLTVRLTSGGPTAGAKPKTFAELDADIAARQLFDIRQDLIDKGKYPQSLSVEDIETGREFVVLSAAIRKVQNINVPEAVAIATSICDTIDLKDEQVARTIGLRVRASDGAIARPLTIVKLLKSKLLKLSMNPKKHIISLFGQRDGEILNRVLF